MNIQEKLEEKLEQLKSLELAKTHLIKLEQRIIKMQKKLNQLHNTLEQEYKDVEQLEKLTVRAMFEKFLGDKEAQLEKEKQEYLNAALHYNEHKKSIELLEFEKDILLKKIETYDKTKSEVHNLIRQREQSLIIEDPLAKQLIQDINKEIDNNVLIKRELNDAIIVGLKINKLMQAIALDLQKVSSWGPYQLNRPDVHIQKKHYVNKAREKVYQANQLLQQFQDELDDIYDDQQVSVQSSLKSFRYFIQSFFDNLISDWVILMKIQNALYTVQQVNDKVVRITRSLQHDLKITDDKLDELKTKKERIILELNTK